MRHTVSGSSAIKAASCLGLLGLLQCSEAALIKNLTTNEILFSDDYESVAATPMATPDPSATFNPSAAVGTWGVLEDAIHDVQVTSSSTPGPYQGSNYLRIYRDPSQSGEVTGTMSSVQGDIHIGEVIHFETMVYIPVGSPNARFQMMLQAHPGDVSTSEAWVRPNGAGHVAVVSAGFAVTDTSVTYTEGVWQKWSLDYAVNGSTFDLSVDNQTATGLPSFYSSGVTGFHIINGSSVTGSAYFDSTQVPEPVSLGLMSIAAVGLMRRRAK